MSVNKYDSATGELVTLASGARIWIGTKAAHTAAVAAGTMPNNCLVCITDDCTDDEDSFKITDATTSYTIVGYRKNGWCMITKNGTAGSVVSNGSPVQIATIPIGFRPAGLVNGCGVYGDAKGCAVQLTTNGVLSLGSWSSDTKITNPYFQLVYPVAGE